MAVLSSSVQVPVLSVFLESCDWPQLRWGLRLLMRLQPPVPDSSSRLGQPHRASLPARRDRVWASTGGNSPAMDRSSSRARRESTALEASFLGWGYLGLPAPLPKTRLAAPTTSPARAAHR